MYEVVDLLIDISPFIFTFVFFTCLFFRELGLVRMQRERLRIERSLSERGSL